MKLNTFAPKKSRAQAMVEFAIVLPLLLLLLYGLLEAGRLLFIYSTIVTATRQAARYGSATGQGGDYTTGTPAGPDNSTVARYQDCFGIRRAAQRVDFLNSFDDNDITINYDSGPGSGIDDTCDGDADSGVTPSADNTSRIVVTIDGDFNPIVPRIVPFIARTVAGNNPISATSARTIVIGVSIEVTSPGGGGPPPPGTFDLQLDMTADKSTYAFEGELVNFEYTLTNNGTVDLSGIVLTPTHGAASCTGSALAVGTSMTCTGSYIITAADLTAGSVVAQATAVATDGTNTVTSNTASVTLTFVVIPEINLLKTASTEYATAGGAVTYTFTLTNTGNVPLSPPFTVTDNLMAVTCPASGDLAPGTAMACTGTYVLTANDIEENTLVNTAQASAMYGTQPINSNQSSATVWTGPLFLRASAAPASLSAPGTVTYTYQLINNTGIPLYPPYTLTGHRGTENCSTNTGAIAVGSSFTCISTYAVTQADLETNESLDNNNIRATACTDSSNCNGPRQITSNIRSVSVDLIRLPALTMAITSATPNPATTLNSVVTYTYTITNTGNVSLSPSITDSRVTGITCSPASPIGPGVSQTCTGTYTVTQADLDAGSFTNTATATAIFAGQTVSSASQSLTIFTYVGPRLRVNITPNPTSFTSAGDFVIYNYTLTNSGSVPLNGPYVVTDSKVTFIDCSPATSPLAVGASTSCVGSYAVTQADVDAGNVINSASITASDGTQTVVSNSAMAVVYIPGAPTITPTATVTPLPSATPTATATQPACTAAPVTLNASADAWVDENSTATNHGSESILSVQSRNNRDARALVQFALPSMPAGCKIQSATLRLYASAPTSGRTLQALQLSGSWMETVVTWANQPAATGSAATTASGSVAGYREWTVTSIVQAMYSGANNGFLIRDASEDAGGSGVLQQFNSRENTNQPQLVITFGQAP